MRRTFNIALALAVPLGFTACGTDAALEVPAARQVQIPAGAGSSLPHVATTEHGAILSWVEPADSGHALLFAEWDGSGWTEPRIVASGTGWFVNWADFPSVIALEDDELAAHWLQRSAAGTYAYDVMISRSHDGGATWSQAVRPHSDGTPTEHGFVSMFPVNGDLGVVWLDGRKFAERNGEAATNEMTLRFATLKDGAAVA
ncbi:MAG TPA: sialidase family protein, partial [Longimicrobiales bacterium]|nr:sialidase family protein [Longimicrobiales bacterium]